MSVTELAAGTAGPERVVGLHFFNPAPVMRLVEVVAGCRLESRGPGPNAGRSAIAMGKRVVDAADVAGFLVNRCNRPYSLESLKLAEERVADVAAIDRIERTAGGFRMGSFELMDLIGIETNHAVAEGLYENSYGEPRYRPSPLSARKVAAGQLGPQDRPRLVPLRRGQRPPARRPGAARARGRGGARSRHPRLAPRGRRAASGSRATPAGRWPVRPRGRR